MFLPKGNFLHKAFPSVLNVQVYIFLKRIIFKQTKQEVQYGNPYYGVNVYDFKRIHWKKEFRMLHFSCCSFIE